MSRVKSLVARANQKFTIQWAATFLASATLLSSLLGLYRDRYLNGLYFDTYKTGLDAYTYAFTIPDFMFYILVSGALSVTFIPIFNKRLATGNKKSAWELSTSVINFMALVTMIASILIMIFAEQLVRLIGPGLDESGHGLAVSMMRVIAINPFLFAIATVIASIQQAVGRFTFYTLAPMIYNIGIIIGAMYFTDGITIFGYEIFSGGIMGVALGVALGSVMQLIVSTIGLIGLGFDYRFKIYWKNKGFRRTIRILPARSIDQALDYIVGMVELNLASHMAAGVARAYQQVLTLYMMPVNLIGVAISTAAFPTMTEHLARDRYDLFRAELRRIIRVILWIMLPVVVITYFARGYVVSFIKNGGNELMAGLMGIFVIAILFRAVYQIAARGFYAQQDTKTPMYVSIFSIGLNVVLAVWFTSSLKLGPAGLALAQSIMAMIEVFILLTLLHIRLPTGLFDKEWFMAVGRMLAAAVITAFAAYGLVLILQLQSDDLNLASTLPKFSFITFASSIVYLGLSHLFKLSEARPVVRKISSLVFAKKFR